MTKEPKDNNSKKEIKRVEPRLNCNFTKAFIEKYFKGSVGDIVTDYILEHLLTCKDCYREYYDYGKSIGVSFNVRETAIKYVTERAKNKKICYTRDALLGLGFEKDLELGYNQWSLAADRLDIEKLMNLKAFSDFASDQITIRADHWEEDTDAIYNYTKWFAKELCRKIDYLEKCLVIDNDNLQSEGKNKDNEKS
jgi:hypothetical protein